MPAGIGTLIKNLRPTWHAGRGRGKTKIPDLPAMPAGVWAERENPRLTFLPHRQESGHRSKLRDLLGMPAGFGTKTKIPRLTSHAGKWSGQRVKIRDLAAMPAGIGTQIKIPRPTWHAGRIRNKSNKNPRLTCHASTGRGRETNSATYPPRRQESGHR